MVGVIFNTFTVTLGSLMGLILKNGIKEKYKNVIMTVIGLCTIALGITEIVKGQNFLVLILSLLFGTILGTLIDIDGKINLLGDFLSARFSKKNGKVSITQGFVTASLLFCIGSMTIVGSLKSGLNGDNSMIYTKSILDLFSSAVLASSLGIGVLFSAIFVFSFQGLLVLLASWVAPFLSVEVIAELCCAGGVMILALGLNLINLTKIKVADFLPALLFIPILSYVFSLIV